MINLFWAAGKVGSSWEVAKKRAFHCMLFLHFYNHRSWGKRIYLFGGKLVDLIFSLRGQPSLLTLRKFQNGPCFPLSRRKGTIQCDMSAHPAVTMATPKSHREAELHSNLMLSTVAAASFNWIRIFWDLWVLWWNVRCGKVRNVGMGKGGT